MSDSDGEPSDGAPFDDESSDRQTGHAIVAGPDVHGLSEALTDQEMRVRRIDPSPTRPALEEAGITNASLLVLTDVGGCTAVPIARDLTDDLRIVVYSEDSVPEFVRGQLDLAVDPRLAEPAIVAEELAT